MEYARTHKQPDHEEELADIISRGHLDIRMVTAMAGDRSLNAREQHTLEKLRAERGEGLYADMLYALTHKAFPSKQAKNLWYDITDHRSMLKARLGRDVGVAVAAHDYLVNVANVLQHVSVVEESKMSSMANVATRDGLTTLYDQTTFRHRLKEELERQVRYGGALSLVMFDIDHFKKINDAYGHAEGDAVIKQLADIVRGCVRRVDTAARYGGEEFAVILPEVDIEAAYIFSERLRQNVEEVFSNNRFPVTISLGVSACKDGRDLTAEDFIKRADEQLYAAKRGGRNQVQCKERQ